MTKRPEPAIPLFGDAYLADTRHLSLEEHGAYMQLLMIAWRSEGCALPDDDARLARMLSITPGKWGKIKPTVMAFWECVEGKWRQRRLTKEREFIEEKRAKNSASAKHRWEANPIENIDSERCERTSERNAPPPLPHKKEERKDEASPHLRASPLPLGEAVDCWNENAIHAGWRQIAKLNTNRRSALGARLREHGLEGWKAAIIRARASPYLGRDPPAWFKFDWLIGDTNFLKLIEGNYDRRQQPIGSMGRHQPDDGIGPNASAAIAVFGDPTATRKH